MTGRRTKPSRKASGLRSSSFSFEKPIKKEEELLEDHLESSSSPEHSNKFAQNSGQVVRETIWFLSLNLLCIVLSLDPGSFDFLDHRTISFANILMVNFSLAGAEYVPL